MAASGALASFSTERDFIGAPAQLTSEAREVHKSILGTRKNFFFIIDRECVVSYVLDSFSPLAIVVRRLRFRVYCLLFVSTICD